MLKNFVITYQEAFTLKLPRIRKYHYKSNIKELNDNQMEEDFDMNNEDYFFDAVFESYNKQELQPEYVQYSKERKRKLLICFSCFSLTVVIVSAIILAIMLLNPYGMRDSITGLIGEISQDIREFFRDKEELYDDNHAQGENFSSPKNNTLSFLQ